MNKRIKVVALVAVLLLPLSQDIFAKGGGGGRSSFSKPSSSGGFFKSPSPPSAPSVRYTPPAPAVKHSPPPAAVKAIPAPSISVSKPVEKKEFFSKAQAQAVPGYDKKAIEAQKHVDSAKAYKEAKAVKSTPQAQVSPSKQASVTQEKKATVHDISSASLARERRVAELSSRMTGGRYREREVRSSAVYGNSLSGQSVPTYYGGGYNDSYSNPYFWYWLTHKNDQAERERFIYNHQAEMDPRRLQELQTAYPDLTSKFEAIKQEGKLPDPSYVPVGLAGNEDLMYGDDVVHQAKEKASEVSSGDFLWIALIMAVLVASFWYVLFGKKWKVREDHV